MEEKHRMATPGELKLSIAKEEGDTAYKGGMTFGNSDVLVEALAVLIQRAADLMGVTVDLVYAKLAMLLFAVEKPKEDESNG